MVVAEVWDLLSPGVAGERSTRVFRVISLWINPAERKLIVYWIAKCVSNGSVLLHWVAENGRHVVVLIARTLLLYVAIRIWIAHWLGRARRYCVVRTCMVPWISAVWHVWISLVDRLYMRTATLRFHRLVWSCLAGTMKRLSVVTDNHFFCVLRRLLLTAGCGRRILCRPGAKPAVITYVCLCVTVRR